MTSSAVAKLALTEEQRHLAVSALRHYRTACSQSGTAFADNIDSTIAALLATAPPEQAALARQWEEIQRVSLNQIKTGNMAASESIMPSMFEDEMVAADERAKQPQPASDGALTGKQIQNAIAKEMAYIGSDSQYQRIADALNAALASHDQKVREQRVTLEQVRSLPRAERPISVVIGFHDGHIIKAEGEGALEFYRAMLDGRKRAEEAPAPAASKPEANRE